MNVREKIIDLCSRVQRYGLYSLVFFIPIYFAWFQENYTVFDLNKAVAMHVLLSITIVSWLTEICLTRQFKWGGNKILGIMGIVLGIGFLISTIFSLHPFISLLGSYERQQGLYNLWSYLGVWVFAVVVIRNRFYIEKLILFLLLGSSLVCLYGLMQAFGLDFLNWGEPGIQRIFSSFGQPNFLGHYLVVVLPFTFYSIFFLSKNIYVKFLYIVLTALQIACIIFTGSRGAWIASIVSFFLFFIWSLVRKNKKILAVIFVLIAIISSVIISSQHVRQTLLTAVSSSNFLATKRLVSILDFESGSNKVRIYYWQAAIQSIKEASWQRKLFGFGPDVLPDVYSKKYQPEWAYYEGINAFPDRAHNFILDINLQFGFVGFLLFGFFTGYIIFNLVRYAWKEKQPKEYWMSICFLVALASYGINNFFSFSLVGMNVVLYVLLGGAWLVANQFRHTETRIKFFQPLSLAVLTIVFSLFLVMLLYNYNLKPLVADYYFFEVKKAEAQGDCRRILDNVEKVLEWYPVSHFYARAYLNSGTNCFLAISDEPSRQQLARNLLEQADRIPKSDWQYLTVLDLAHLYSMLGYYIDKKYYLEAEIYYKQLIFLGPMISTSYQDYGRMKLEGGKNIEAINLFKKGIENARLNENIPPVQHVAAIYRQVAYFNNLLGHAYSKEKDYDNAVMVYKKAIDLDPLEGSYYKDIADYYYERKNITQAIYYNKLGNKISPHSEPWNYLIALLYNEKGDIKTALEYAHKAATLDPENFKIKDFIEKMEMKK